MHDVAVIDDPSAAVVALDPTRSRILAALTEPGSATSVAARLQLPRQKVNYHLRALEEHGLVRPVGERRRRGLTERIVVASAASYVVSPGALGQAGADPRRAQDQLSARYLVAVAARVVDEVGRLLRRAEARSGSVSAMTLDTEIRFRSAAERAAFASDAQRAVMRLVARYHDDAAPSSRRHRIVLAAYPVPPAPRADDDRATDDEERS